MGRGDNLSDIVISQIPRIFRKGGVFKPTGTIIHDDYIDFAGSFNKMIDVNDKLEMETTREIYQQTQDGTKGVGADNEGAKFKAITPRVAYVKIRVINTGSSTYIFYWRLGTSIGDSSLGSGSWTQGAGVDQWKQIDLNANLTKNNWYYLTISSNNGTYCRMYRYYAGNLNDDTLLFEDGTEKPTREAVVQFYFVNDIGDYESQSIDVGAGVDWGIITWTEVLDGATVVVQVNTSPDDIDWTEAKQTVSSGDYVTGNNRYLRYYITITNGTADTEVDDINIEYAV